MRFPIENPVFWKKKLLRWAAAHPNGVFLDSNGAAERWECLAAAGAQTVLEANAGNAFEKLRTLLDEHPNAWLFGFFGYDLKNELEQLESRRPDGIGLPALGFFLPQTVLGIQAGSLEILTTETEPEALLKEIETLPEIAAAESTPLELRPRIAKETYLGTVDALRQHIIRGDIYEVNFCQEFFAENAILDPVTVFERLNQIGQAPFSCFLRWRDRYLLSASPERFFKKENQQITSQPIKGTRRRGHTPEEDARIRAALAASEKDRSENVMIVDLVRNDFSRNCLPGSVRVEELCEIYSFATVHQMISTVSGILPAETHWLDALRDAFPMGSMTGAPKIMAMDIIERYERTRRGLYSGALGYVAPNGDVDFNVVIRSILHNAATGYVSAQVGGAIVFDSAPEEEYEECLVKVAAMVRALGGSGK